MKLTTQSSMAQAQQAFVADVQSLQALKQNAGKQTREGLEKVAREFESLYLKMMLDSMRKAGEVWADDNPLASREQTMFRDMLDGQYARELSSKGALGLADMLVKQLSPFLQENTQEKPEPEQANKVQLTPFTSFDVNEENNEIHVETYNNKINSNPNLNFEFNATADPPGQLSEAAGRPDDFIQALLPLAQEPARKLGVDPKLLVAQAALETGWGKTLSNQNHGFNLFGIKNSSNWQGKTAVHLTHEIYDGRKIKENAAFKVYNSPKDSLEDYVDLIKRRYLNTREVQTPEEYVQSLASGGYATDPDYADKILAIYNSARMKNFSNTMLAMETTQPGVQYSKLISDIW